MHIIKGGTNFLMPNVRRLPSYVIICIRIWHLQQFPSHSLKQTFIIKYSGICIRMVSSVRRYKKFQLLKPSLEPLSPEYHLSLVACLANFRQYYVFFLTLRCYLLIACIPTEGHCLGQVYSMQCMLGDVIVPSTNIELENRR